MTATLRCLVLLLAVFETISANSANTQERGNAWSSGSSNIDWNHVGRGGQNSGTRGTSSGSNRNTGSSSGSSSGGASVTPQSVSSNELRRLSEELFTMDTNSVGEQISMDPQGRTAASNPTDKASEHLFAPLPSSTLNGPTIGPLYALLDNYNPAVTARESDTQQEVQEQHTFLNAVMATPVMARTQTFLSGKGLISKPLKDVLQEIWFTPYPRSRRTLSSSGFEHVFVGEVKDNKVSGFHNWVSFYKEEQEGDLDYYGHMRTVSLGPKAQMIMLKFSWTDDTKPIGSMFVGTSPELDMAMYTICFFARQGNNCPLSLNGHRFNIKTHTQTYKGKTLVGTAYPNI